MKLPDQVVVTVRDDGEATCAACAGSAGQLQAVVLAADGQGWDALCDTCWRDIAARGVCWVAGGQDRF